MKAINIQRMYEIPDEYLWIASNRDGVIVGFCRAPIRDFEHGEWIDPTDGSTGEIVPCVSWETTARRMAELTDMRVHIAQVRLIRKEKNAEMFRERYKKVPDFEKKRRLGMSLVGSGFREKGEGRKEEKRKREKGGKKCPVHLRGIKRNSA